MGRLHNQWILCKGFKVLMNVNRLTFRNTFFQIKLNFTPSDIIPFMVVTSISTNPISFVVPLFQSGFPKIVTNFRHYVIRSVTPYCDKIYFVNTLQSDFRTFVMRSCQYLGINASFSL